MSPINSVNVMDSKYICTLCKVPRVCVSVPHAVLSPGAVPETVSECTVSALVGYRPAGETDLTEQCPGAAVGMGHWAKKAQSRGPDLGPAGLNARGNLDLYETKEFPVLNANFLGTIITVNSCPEK